MPFPQMQSKGATTSHPYLVLKTSEGLMAHSVMQCGVVCATTENSATFWKGTSVIVEAIEIVRMFK